MTPGIRQEGAAILTIKEYKDPRLNDTERQRIRIIEGLRTDPDKRNQGDARYLMSKVCIEANQARTVLLLECRPEADSPLDVDQLENFYRVFGFRVVQKQPKMMARRPM